MANLVNNNLFSGIYKSKRVFITGHSGFKGSWLSLWLQMMGAKVFGYSLPPNTKPHHLGLLNLDIEEEFEDIRTRAKLNEAINNFSPDIVFHLAAQPLVRYSYENPFETFETNVIGSLNVYEAAKNCPSVKALVSITTDKVYENYELTRGYTEEDRFGGKDPYSASKAAMEILTNSYRESFLIGKNNAFSRKLPLAVARAGNVIGGGDWADDRLIPDLVRNANLDKTTSIRNPRSTRPWQHVVEPLSGYLLMGQKLLEGDPSIEEGFNLGPPPGETLTVEEMAKLAKQYWGKINYEFENPSEKLHEAALLQLDCSKASSILKWRSIWSAPEALDKTISWYRNYYENKKVQTREQLIEYVGNAKEAGACWTS